MTKKDIAKDIILNHIDGIAESYAKKMFDDVDIIKHQGRWILGKYGHGWPIIYFVKDNLKFYGRYNQNQKSRPIIQGEKCPEIIWNTFKLLRKG